MAKPSRMLFAFIFPFLFFALARSNSDKCTPQQIHLSLGDQYYTVSRFDDLWLPTENFDENQAYVIWTAQLKCKFNLRIISSSSGNSANQNVADVIDVKTMDHYFYDFSHDEGVTNPGKYDNVAFIVPLSNLDYDSRYQYEIINVDDSSKATGPFAFTLVSPNMPSNPKKIIFMGDTSLSERGNKTIARLTSEVSKHPDSYAGLVYLGNVAYDLHDDQGKKGDDFFNAIQNITSQIPLIVTPGNRDNHDHWDFLNFRIRNPLYSMTHNQYYSYNWQGIHFISINFDYYNQATQDVQEEIYSWIERDLNTANDNGHRALWPWIVVFSHQPIYCTYNNPASAEEERCYTYFNQMKTWDALFYRYGVDLMISARLNSYERMGPVNKNESVSFTQQDNDPTRQNLLNPTAAVFIIEGAGGNDQYLPSEYQAGGYGFVTDRNPGYGVLYATTDNGEARLRYEHYDSETGQMIDEMNIIKTHEAVVESKTAEYVFIILGVGFVCVGLTFGFIKVKQWREMKLQEAEDNVPLNKDTLISSRLRYNRPGQRGISMVDM